MTPLLRRNIFLLLSFCAWLSCSKRSGSAEDKQSPVIQFTVPANNQVFTAGQPVVITGTITDNDKIAEIHVHISNNNTAQLLVDIHRFPAAASYALNENFTPTAGITYKIQLIAVDKSGNQAIESVMVSGV